MASKPGKTFLIAAFLLCVSVQLNRPEAAKNWDGSTPGFISENTRSVYLLKTAAIKREPRVNSPRVKKMKPPAYFEVQEEKGRFLKVKHSSGVVGWIDKKFVDDLWIHIKKTSKKMTVLRGTKIIHKYRIDRATNPIKDKVMSGDNDSKHYRTPDGEFYVCGHVPNSRFYKAFLLSYPNGEDAERGLKDKLISKTQYRRIMSSLKNGDCPLMNTTLGGLIEIHGHGTGGLWDWTQGCIAIRDKNMDELWPIVKKGTPVIIEK